MGPEDTLSNYFSNIDTYVQEALERDDRTAMVRIAYELRQLTGPPPAAPQPFRKMARQTLNRLGADILRGSGISREDFVSRTVTLDPDFS